MREYKRADARNPHMGLYNRICRNPEYWCKLHQVWLSENDVAKKQCKNKPTFDMIGTVRCGNLVKRSDWEKGRVKKNEHYKNKNRKRQYDNKH